MIRDRGTSEEDKPRYYDIEFIDFDGTVGIAVEGEFDDDASAINWAYFFLGKYHGMKAKVYRGHTNPRDASTFVIEISSAGMT
jgi:hypothetical protein